MTAVVDKPRLKPRPNMMCWECEGYGQLQRNPKFKEPYGYPYRALYIDCTTCHSVGWIYIPRKFQP